MDNSEILNSIPHKEQISNEKNILCYGDSNTWGYVPINILSENKTIKRFPRTIRWPGLLQQFLGKDFYIIEEGLNSRTIDEDYHIPPDRNGLSYILPCLYSHAPIDLVIVALGGNDMKSYFNKSANQIARSMSNFIDTILSCQYGSDFKSPPEVLLLTQPIPLEISETYQDEHGEFFLENVVQKATELVSLYCDIAKDKGCHVLDITKDVTPSDIDGVHLNEVGHKNLAKIIETKIRTIFNEA